MNPSATQFPMHYFKIMLLPTNKHFRAYSDHCETMRVLCKSSDLIYCITCNICNLQYIGHTKCRLMDQFQGHFCNINSKNQKDAIGHHFNQPSYNGISNIEVHIADFIHAYLESDRGLQVRRTIERNSQQCLRTNAPHGLNIRE